MRRIIPFALALLLCGCASHATASPNLPVLEMQTAAKQTSWLSKDVKPGVALVYASSYPECGGCVLVFRQDNGALVGLLSNGLTIPNGLATDGSGTLYIANNGGNGFYDILEYPQGALQPSKALDDLESPEAVVVAEDGTVYVSNFGPTASVFVYAEGANSPTSQLFDVNAVIGYGIALDNRGNVYWGFSTPTGYQIDKFVHGKTKPINLGIALTDVPGSIAFDKMNRLVVSAQNGLDIYELPNTLVGQIDLTVDPIGIAFNRFKSIFVADQAASNIDQYSYPGGTLKKTIAPPNFNPRGVAVFPKP